MVKKDEEECEYSIIKINVFTPIAQSDFAEFSHHSAIANTTSVCTLSCI